MACLTTSLICLLLMASVKSQANISAEAGTGASNAKHWIQMQNAGRKSGSGCSNDKCVESCEEDWEKNGDHCYKWNTAKRNWTAAEDFCRKEGGHLASVHSNTTFYFVLEGMNRTGLKMAWLGANDLEVEGTWKWVDCSPWNVTFWARGEPNNGVAAANEHCLHHVFSFPPLKILNHKWNDVQCSKKQGFLCSKTICSGDIEKSVSEPTVSAVTGDSVMWKPATISLVATLIIPIFF